MLSTVTFRHHTGIGSSVKIFFTHPNGKGGKGGSETGQSRATMVLESIPA